MAGRGPAPKGTRSRARDQRRDESRTTTVEADEILRGPDLPEDLTGADGEPLDWPAQTRRWWLTWRRAPQASLFLGTDWCFLLDTALLHRLFVMGRTDLAGEIRLRVAKLGATPEDRARLRLTVAEPAPVRPAAQADEIRAKRDERVRRLLDSADD